MLETNVSGLTEIKMGQLGQNKSFLSRPRDAAPVFITSSNDECRNVFLN